MLILRLSNISRLVLNLRQSTLRLNSQNGMPERHTLGTKRVICLLPLDPTLIISKIIFLRSEIFRFLILGIAGTATLLILSDPISGEVRQ